MKDKKKIEILFTINERIFSKNPEMQKLINESMIDVCKDEVFSYYYFSLLLSLS